MRKTSLFILLLTSAFIAWGSATAQYKKDMQGSRLHNLKALQLMKQKQYMKAIREFQIAFYLFPNSKPLINIAKTYGILKRPDLSIEYYKMAVEHSKDAAEKSQLNKQINELRQGLLQKQTHLQVITQNANDAEVSLYKQGSEIIYKRCLSPCTAWIPKGEYVIKILKKEFDIVEDEISVAGNGVFLNHTRSKGSRPSE